MNWNISIYIVAKTLTSQVFWQLEEGLALLFKNFIEQRQKNQEKKSNAQLQAHYAYENTTRILKPYRNVIVW